MPFSKQPMASYVQKLSRWNQCVLNKHGLLQVKICNINTIQNFHILYHFIFEYEQFISLPSIIIFNPPNYSGP